MKKEEVKLLMKQNQVKQWEVAEAMGISEFNSAIKKVRNGKEETHGEEKR